MSGPKRNFEIGEKASLTKVISAADIIAYAEITGDTNPVHLNDDIARKTRFKGRIAHGMLSAGLISAVLGTKLPGPGGIYLSQTLKFIKPVRPGDEISAEVEVTGWRPDKSILTLNTRCFDREGEDVLLGEAVLLVEAL